MKKSFAAMVPIALTALLAVSCRSSKPMMMSDHSTMSSDGTMLMGNSDGTSRAMTDQEMQAHMQMMMADSRYSSMMMERCKSMGMMSNGSSSGMSNNSMSGISSGGGTAMMVMNSDGTTRAMTDAEYRSQMDMMMKSSQMSAMMTNKCSGM